MKLLLDTHLLLWAALGYEALPASASALMADPENELFFSSVSVWEVAIKFSRRRPDFVLHPERFRRRLLERAYEEVAITSAHILATTDLPLIHRDPFDRMLVAQAAVEELSLLTVDATVLRYPGRLLKG